jgi:hypothetical protein
MIPRVDLPHPPERKSPATSLLCEPFDTEQKAWFLYLYSEATQAKGQNMREKTERWMELCAQVAKEQDPKKLMAMVKEVIELLEAKERRLGIFPEQSAEEKPE